MKGIIAVILFSFSSLIVTAQESRGVVIVDFIPSGEMDNFSLPYRFIDLKLRPLILKSLTDKSYIVGGKRLKNFPALSPYLAHDIRYGLDFRHALSIRNQSKVLAIMTGVVFISSLASLKLKTGGPPVGFDAIGLLVGVPILSILTGVAASRYDGKRSKVEKLLLMTHIKIEHNKKLDPIASLNLGLTQNGIGLVLNF